MSDLWHDDPELYKMIGQAIKGFELDVTALGTMEHVQEAENFWRKLVSQYDGIDDRDSKVAWLRAQVPKYFRSFADKPRWIQNPDWQFAGGFPMIFAGQIDVKRTNDNLAGKLYHDDVSYYVFVASYDLIVDGKYYEKRITMQQW
jgi:hypothetical protein